MPRATPPALNLAASTSKDATHTLGPHSAPVTGTPLSPTSIPGSPMVLASTPISIAHPSPGANDPNNATHLRNGTTSPRITAMPEVPSSPVPGSPKHGRDPSRSFFSNLIASKSSHKISGAEGLMQETSEKEKSSIRSRASSKDRSQHTLRKQESYPEMPKFTGNGNKHANSSQLNTTADSPENSAQQDITPVPTDSQSHQAMVANKKSRSKLAGILIRNKNTKVDETQSKPSTPIQINLDSSPMQNGTRDQYNEPKTAPIHVDYRERTFGAANGSMSRNRSADRALTDNSTPRTDRPGTSIPNSQSYRDSTTFFGNMQQTGKGVGDRLGKVGKGFFGRITRSASTNERELVTDDTYTCTTINLPLVKQTRKTRIARRLELSKDKTEFWMPALPWRCIDYLNMNGCEEEGLYRIPGSGKDVKHWQRRFDLEHDIDLFEEPDLYDINTIGSMFKSWLRELPDEILPKLVQNKISSQCAGATEVPQLMKDELSRLPPFNYYLLFAITCHLSLLNSFADKNKMDYRNLCICFQPCLKIDAFCFHFLVMDWKNCWQGCWTEKEHLEEEYRYLRQGSVDETNNGGNITNTIPTSGSLPPASSNSAAAAAIANERAISSSGSSQAHGPTKSTDTTHTNAIDSSNIPNNNTNNPVPSINTNNGTLNTNMPRRPSTAKPNQPSMSSSNEGRQHQKSRSDSQPAPTFSRLVRTPEPPKSVSNETSSGLTMGSTAHLPEVGNLSPIRM